MPELLISLNWIYQARARSVGAEAVTMPAHMQITLLDFAELGLHMLSPGDRMVEAAARGLCVAAGDNPDAISYSMSHVVGMPRWVSYIDVANGFLLQLLESVAAQSEQDKEAATGSR